MCYIVIQSRNKIRNLHSNLTRLSLVTLHNIEIGYPHRTLIDAATAQFSKGELVALVGRNGSGKSTLLRAIAGLEPPQSGTITIDEKDIINIKPLERASTVSFVTTERHRIAGLRVEDLVALGRAPYTNWVGRMQEIDRQIVESSLELVAMSHMSQRSVERLSDGELQRVMIARALAQQTPVMLLDEPTAFLDMPSRYELIALLTKLAHSEQKCIIFSTHELDIAQNYCDRIALIHNSQLSSLSKGDNHEIIEHAFNITTQIK